MNDTQSNVRQITDKQPQAVAKFSITCQIDGFQIQVEIEGKADALRGMIDRLKAIGAQPPSSTTNPQMQNSCNTDDAPVCEFHGKMKRSNHGGWFCPKRMGNGEYCKSKG